MYDVINLREIGEKLPVNVGPELLDIGRSISDIIGLAELFTGEGMADNRDTPERSDGPRRYVLSDVISTGKCASLQGSSHGRNNDKVELEILLLQRLASCLSLADSLTLLVRDQLESTFRVMWGLNIPLAVPLISQAALASDSPWRMKDTTFTDGC